MHVYRIYVLLLGTFGASDRLTNETECTQCSGGHYCDVPGLSQPADVCHAGYYCVSGIIEMCSLS